MLLRKWNLNDIASLQKYADNPKIVCNLRDTFPNPYTLDNAREFIESRINDDETNTCYRAIEIDGEAVGGIGLTIQDDIYKRSAEIGYWLGEPFWGRGIVTQAVTELTEYGFNNYDIIRIYAGVFDYNKASQRVLEKAGYTLEGILRRSIFKNGKVFDSCMYAKVKTL